MRNRNHQQRLHIQPWNPITNTLLRLALLRMKDEPLSILQVTWRRINSSTHVSEDITAFQNCHTYQCSPLDLQCIVEAKILFEHAKLVQNQIVTSNLVGLNAQLKVKRDAQKETMVCMLLVNEQLIPIKVSTRSHFLVLISSNSNSPIIHMISFNDLQIETCPQNAQFKLILKQKTAQFTNYLSSISTFRPTLQIKTALLRFNSDLEKDIILLNFVEELQKESFTNRKIQRKRENNLFMLNKTIHTEMQRNFHNSEVTLPTSPHQIRNNTSKKDFERLRIPIKVDPATDKTAQTQPSNQLQKVKSPKSLKFISKALKQRHYLNIFEQEEVFTRHKQFPSTYSNFVSPSQAINLRESFEQFEKGYSNLVNENIDFCKSRSNQRIDVDNFSNGNDKSKKDNQQIQSLKQQFEQLKKNYLQMQCKYDKLNLDMQNLEARNKRLEADSKFYETNWRREAQVRAVLQQKLENMRQGGPLEKPQNKKINNLFSARIGRSEVKSQASYL